MATARRVRSGTSPSKESEQPHGQQVTRGLLLGIAVANQGLVDHPLTDHLGKPNRVDVSYDVAGGRIGVATLVCPTCWK
jgi:hypothetical protein